MSDSRQESRRNIQKLLKSTKLLKQRLEDPSYEIKNDGRISEHLQEYRPWPLISHETISYKPDITGSPYPLYIDPSSSLPVSNFVSEHHSSFNEIDPSNYNEVIPAGVPHLTADTAPKFFAYGLDNGPSESSELITDHVMTSSTNPLNLTSECHESYKWPDIESTLLPSTPNLRFTNAPSTTIQLGVTDQNTNPSTWQSEYFERYLSPIKLSEKESTSHLLNQMKKINRILAQVDHDPTTPHLNDGIPDRTSTADISAVIPYHIEKYDEPAGVPSKPKDEIPNFYAWKLLYHTDSEDGHTDQEHSRPSTAETTFNSEYRVNFKKPLLCLSNSKDNIHIRDYENKNAEDHITAVLHPDLHTQSTTTLLGHNYTLTNPIWSSEYHDEFQSKPLNSTTDTIYSHNQDNNHNNNTNNDIDRNEWQSTPIHKKTSSSFSPAGTTMSADYGSTTPSALAHKLAKKSKQYLKRTKIRKTTTNPDDEDKKWQQKKKFTKTSTLTEASDRFQWPSADRNIHTDLIPHDDGDFPSNDDDDVLKRTTTTITTREPIIPVNNLDPITGLPTYTHRMRELSTPISSNVHTTANRESIEPNNTETKSSYKWPTYDHQYNSVSNYRNIVKPHKNEEYFQGDKHENNQYDTDRLVPSSETNNNYTNHTNDYVYNRDNRDSKSTTAASTTSHQFYDTLDVPKSSTMMNQKDDTNVTKKVTKPNVDTNKVITAKKIFRPVIPAVSHTHNTRPSSSYKSSVTKMTSPTKDTDTTNLNSKILNRQKSTPNLHKSPPLKDKTTTNTTPSHHVHISVHDENSSLNKLYIQQHSDQNQYKWDPILINKRYPLESEKQYGRWTTEHRGSFSSPGDKQRKKSLG